MTSRNQDDSDTDWDSIYEEHDEDSQHDEDEGSAPHASYQNRSDVPTTPKGMEAASERRPDLNPPPPPSSSQAQPSTWVDETTPLFDAPPAYSDITPNRTYSGHAPSQVRPDDGGEDGHTSFSEPVKRRSGGKRHHRLLKMAIVVLVVILATVLATTTWRHASQDGTNAGDRDEDHGHDGDGHNGDDNTRPPELPSNDTWWTSPDLDGCNFQHYSVSSSFEFKSPQSFSFLELMEDKYLKTREIGGLVKLTAAPASQTAAIVVSIWFATTEHYEVSEINVKQTRDSLSVHTPSLVATGADHGKPCLVVHATIFIRRDVDLYDLEIVTHYCHIRVDPSLFSNNRSLKIRDSTEFTAISGDIDIAYWSSRRTIIDVISGDVSGTYSLQDLLSITTRSGSIDVDVKPQRADKSAPAPAQFSAETISGDISARFPISGTDDDIPEREYHTKAETKSGKICGTYVLGLKSTFETISGTIAVDVLPYAADMFESILRTDTKSGTTSLNVLSPFQNEGRPISRLKSYHKTLSSSLNLIYPQEWEGFIVGTSVSGTLVVEGKDVHITRHSDWPGSKSISAEKGSGGSTMDFTTISGDVDAVVGDLN